MKVRQNLFFVPFILVGLLAAIPLSYLMDDGDSTPVVVTTRATDIQDPPSFKVEESSIAPLLVQLGTTINYTGYGGPGFVLEVNTPSPILNWTVEAWITQTSADVIPLCTSATVHYDPYNWQFQASGGGSETRLTFTSVPSTVPQRLGQDGDQCFARVMQTGTWKICLEAKSGGPRGLYDTFDGRHFDGWDYCKDATFQV